MAAHRAKDSRGRFLDYTCGNRRFETNWRKGESHSPYSSVKGSLTSGPLVDHEGWTLWLEHVVERATENECFWLMWYTPDGKPTIPLSGVLYRDELGLLVEKLTKVV